MAHALLNYDGLCRNIHGHSYILYVTVIGQPNEDIKDPKCGMVMDFGDLKSIVSKEIVDVLDHSIVLNNKIPDKDQLNISQMFDRMYFVDYQPTCENMIADFAQRIIKHLPNSIDLYSLKLHETASSFAEWYAVDNQ